MTGVPGPTRAPNGSEAAGRRGFPESAAHIAWAGLNAKALKAKTTQEVWKGGARAPATRAESNMGIQL